jgi:hypothetical protein
MVAVTICGKLFLPKCLVFRFCLCTFTPRTRLTENQINMNAQLIEMHRIFIKYGISQPKVAALMGMNPNTFRTKFNQNVIDSKFSPTEFKQLQMVLVEMFADVRSVVKLDNIEESILADTQQA